MRKEIDEDLVRRLAALLGETGLTEIEYSGKDWSLRVVRSANGAVQFSAAAPPTPAAPASAAAERPKERAGAVLSPMVGTVFLAPEPGAEPFVKTGDKVRQGQTVAIVEAMKVMNPIPAPRNGTVIEVAIGNGQPVEYGELLMVIE
jgi:acetyl-CoA carboxylase biotin carboxyl carrier protein